MLWASYLKLQSLWYTNFEFKFQTKLEFKQRRRKIKQKKEKEGKKAHSWLGLLGPLVHSSQPAQLARAAAGQPNLRCQPSKQLGATLTPACLPASLLSLPAGPHLSAFLFIFSTPTPQPPV